MLSRRRILAGEFWRDNVGHGSGLEIEADGPSFVLEDILGLRSL